MKKSKIAGIAFNVPDNIVTNHDIEEMMDTTDEWIQTRSGIKERRWVLPGTPNSDLALPACVKAIENAGISPNDIDAIIVGTVSSDYNFPGMGPIIQRKLGIKKNIPAYDISAACSAFIYLLEMGDQYIKSGKYSNILLVGSDLMSTIIDRTPEGRATGVLFGDGSGAVVLQESNDESQILSTHLYADGDGVEHLTAKAPGSVFNPLRIDEDIVKEQFNISYTDDEKQLSLSKVYSGQKGPAEGYLKLKFDYRDGFLPRSAVTFYYSNDFNTWEQLGSKHTSGYVINLIENNSYFEVGGYADGQSPGDMYLRGIIQKLNINSEEFKLEAIFDESTKDKDYFIFLPASDRSFDNRHEGAIRYEQNGLKLIKPRSYWIGVPNSYNLSGKDFEVVLKVKFDEIPNGNQTLFSQSSILYANDQSWKWSIINGKMYFFWIEDLMSGYSNFVGGMSMRSAELISDNGAFDSKISDFSLGQYDEITTSHNGFLTMAVEYGLFPVIILFSCICYLTIINLKKDFKLESVLMIMLLIQNFTNDLIYAPDVAIYFWLIPIYFFKKFLSS